MHATISRTRWQDVDLWILVIGAAGVIPFLYSTRTADPLLTPRFLALGGMCVGLFLHGVVKTAGRSRPPVPVAGHVPFFTILLIHLAVSLLSLTQAVNGGEGVVQWSRQLLVTAFTYGAFRVLGPDIGRVHWLTRSIIPAGLVLGVLGWIQWYDPVALTIPGHFTVRGTMGNKNLYASALFLVLPFACFGMLQYRGKWRLLAWISGVVVGGAIVITRTRSVWLAVITACVWVAVAGRTGDGYRSGLPVPTLHPRRKGSAGRRTMAVAVLLPLLVGAVTGGLAIHEKAADPDHLVSLDSLDQRRQLWAAAVRMALDRPLVGIGTGQWKLRLPEYGPENRTFQVDRTVYESVFIRPHNDYLWVLAENGLPGLFCLVAAFGILLWKCIRACFTAADGPDKRLAVCMLFGVVGMIVISGFSFPRERIFHNVYFALIAAVVLGQDHRIHRSSPGRMVPPERWRLAIALALCLLCTLMGGVRYQSDRHFQQALQERSAGRYAAAIDQFDRSRNRFYSLGPAAVPVDWYRGMMHVNLGRIDLAADAFSQAAVAHPFHYHSLNNAAVCHSLAGDPERAGSYRRRLGRLGRLTAATGDR